MVKWKSKGKVVGNLNEYEDEDEDTCFHNEGADEHEVEAVARVSLQDESVTRVARALG